MNEARFYGKVIRKSHIGQNKPDMLYWLVLGGASLPVDLLQYLLGAGRFLEANSLNIERDIPTFVWVEAICLKEGWSLTLLGATSETIDNA